MEVILITCCLVVPHFLIVLFFVFAVGYDSGVMDYQNDEEDDDDDIDTIDAEDIRQLNDLLK